QPLAQLRQARLVVDDGDLRPPSQRLLGQLAGVAPGGERQDLDVGAGLRQQAQRRDADGAGRTQDGDGAGHWSQPWSCMSRAAATTTTANISPSTRSSRPPWPGMRSPESFTPKRRFSI